jgi:hypothetical protein
MDLTADGSKKPRFDKAGFATLDVDSKGSDASAIEGGLFDLDNVFQTDLADDSADDK